MSNYESEVAELTAEREADDIHAGQLARHPDPRDPDHPGHAEPDDEGFTAHIQTIAEWLSIALLANERGDTKRIRQCIDEIHVECAVALGMD